MLFKGGRKALKEPEVVAFQCVVAKSIMNNDEGIEHGERDIIVEAWLNTKSTFDEIKEAVEYTKSKSGFNEAVAEYNQKAEEEALEKAWKESREKKLEYVR